MIEKIITHGWRGPMLRILAERREQPIRYVDLRSRLIEMRGRTPGDGFISTELGKMRDLGLVERRAISGSRRQGWTATSLGTSVVTIVEDIEDPEVAITGSPNDEGSDKRTVLSNAHSSKLDGEAEAVEPIGISMNELEARAASIDTSIAHSARRYNYWLGGKDNFPADRESGDAIESAFPAVRLTATENRAFLGRVVSFLAGEAGIDQFLDVGTGLPTAANTHEVAQCINPSSRVVYVDNDPMVMAHARALLTSTPQGRTTYLEEDLTHPTALLAHPDLKATIDVRRPVALLLIAVLHFIEDDQAATEAVRRLLAPLPPGSYVALSHFTLDSADADDLDKHCTLLEERKTDAYPRTRAQIGELLAGTTLLKPGIVPISQWRSVQRIEDCPTLAEVSMYGAVARKD